MYRSSFLLLALTLSWPQSAYATRIYSFVDYPDLQNGHSLSGTITTTEDAPDDGLLQTEEILDWEWEISGGNSATASFSAASLTQISGIKLSDTLVEIPFDSEANFRLTSFSPDEVVNRFIWTNRMSTGTTDQFSSLYTTGYIGRDGLIPYWFVNNLNSSEDLTWVIARAIPEPSTLTFCFFVILVAWQFRLRDLRHSNYAD